MRFILRGGRSIWWSWRMTLVASRIVNDFSYVMRINHEIHFAWQAQYLLKLEDDSCCSAHCKWPSICEHGQSWAAVGCALSSSHPTTQAFRLRCRVASDCPRPSLPCNAWFFSIGLLVSYRFMFFFIDWKLPPPACPGTTGIYNCYHPFWRLPLSAFWSYRKSDKPAVDSGSPLMKSAAYLLLTL